MLSGAMAHTGRHYERAFEAYLRARRTPYVSVDEARQTLLPVGRDTCAKTHASANRHSLKSFDFVVSAEGSNLLVDVKGRKASFSRRPGSNGRLESWVTQEDVDSLRIWQELFGKGFRAAFVFLYWCERQPPDALFPETLEWSGRWYALRTVLLEDYVAAMKPRSTRWRTVHLPQGACERLSSSLSGPTSWPGARPSPSASRRTVRQPSLNRAAHLADRNIVRSPA